MFFFMNDLLFFVYFIGICWIFWFRWREGIGWSKGIVIWKIGFKLIGEVLCLLVIMFYFIFFCKW